MKKNDGDIMSETAFVVTLQWLTPADRVTEKTVAEAKASEIDLLREIQERIPMPIEYAFFVQRLTWYFSDTDLNHVDLCISSFPAFGWISRAWAITYRSHFTGGLSGG